MYRASSLINKHGMHSLYYSLFLAYITYCAEVWGNAYAANIHCLVCFITEEGYAFNIVLLFFAHTTLLLTFIGN